MPQSLAQVYLHTIFSTKDRFGFLEDLQIRTDTHSYLAGCAKALGCLPVRIGGVADHVHLLTSLSRTMSIADFVKETKRSSSNWLHERGGAWEKFHWQSGYGVFSVSQSNVEAVANYIDRQEEHHRKESFQDEFRRFLEKHGLSGDERYLWD
jgi:REP element-mobilizing transposase RayT